MTILELAKFIKESKEDLFYLQFPKKIAYGNKYSIVYFLSNNLFDSEPILISKEEFQSSQLKKVLVEIQGSFSNNSNTTTNNTTNTNTSGTGIINKSLYYENPIQELIKAVNNLKEITGNQQKILTQITQ
jgi:hypothetical protein